MTLCKGYSNKASVKENFKQRSSNSMSSSQRKDDIRGVNGSIKVIDDSGSNTPLLKYVTSLMFFRINF